MKRYQGQQIDIDGLEDGLYYLIDVSPECGENFWELRTSPGCTNMSHEARLMRWLGSTNKVSRTACGVVELKGGRLRKIDANEDHARIMAAQEIGEE
jgi:hypothetical protein